MAQISVETKCKMGSEADFQDYLLKYLNECFCAIHPSSSWEFAKISLLAETPPCN